MPDLADYPAHVSPRRELILRGLGYMPNYWDFRASGLNRLKASRIYKAERARRVKPPWRMGDGSI